MAIRKKAREDHTSILTESRDYSKYNEVHLRDLLLNIDWNLYDASIDPNEMYEFILKHVKRILEIMCPLRSYRQRKNSGLWMNAEIYRAIRNRIFYVSDEAE